MSLSDVIQWIHVNRKTGTLAVTAELEDTYLCFDNGEVVAVGSNDPLRLDAGQALRAKGLITEDAHLAALSRAKGVGTVIDALVANGEINEDVVATFQQEYVFTLLLDLFLCPEGSFQFTPADSVQDQLLQPELPEIGYLKQPISTQRLLLESMQQLDEWRRIQEIFPSSSVAVHALKGGSDNPVVQTLLDSGDLLTVGELCLRMGRSRFWVFMQLAAAYREGLLAVDQASRVPIAPARGEPVEMLIQNARVLLDEQQYDEAREILSTALNLAPDHPVGVKMLRDLRSEQLGHLYQIVPPHRVPVLGVPRERLKSLQLTAREAFLAARINGQLDVTALVVSTPLGELDTLRALRKFLHAGIIYFREEE